MNALSLNALEKSELVQVARHIGKFRGDDARTKKSAFVEILTPVDSTVIHNAMSELGIFHADYSDDTSERGQQDYESEKVTESKTVTAPETSNAAAMLQAAIEQIAGNSKAPVDLDSVKALIDEKLTGINEIIAAAVAEISAPTKVTIVDTDGTERALDGVQHKNMPKLLTACSAKDHTGNRLNIWLTGPAGSGKTTAGEKIAEALGLSFAAVGTSDNKYEVTGFTDANGRIVNTVFREKYENGGVLILDEIDGWFPNALLALNAALANGYALFPDGMIKRHKDLVVIACANTYGTGGTQEYVGRMKQDAAFLDRFVQMDWPVDEDLEASIASDSSWCREVQKYRARAAALGMKVIISPRATYLGCSLLAAGMDREDVIMMTIKKGMTDDQWKQVNA